MKHAAGLVEQLGLRPRPCATGTHIVHERVIDLRRYFRQAEAADGVVEQRFRSLIVGPRRIAQFTLGQIVATHSALALMDQYAINAMDLIKRHQSGDWGNVPPGDAEENLRSVENGWRILSSYALSENQNLWIITEADRSVTTLLLPEEY